MAKSKDRYIKIIDGNYWARVTYLDQFGKRHEVKRRAENKTHAKQLAQKLLLEIQQHGQDSLGNAQMTVLELVQHYEEKYLIAPKYVGDRKVTGVRGHNRCNFILEAIKDYFGKKKLRGITASDIENFKLKRLETKTRQRDGQRSITTVNRELALLRRMLNIAHREGWIIKNPFDATEKLISTADEKKRDRILTKEEEILLLDKCLELKLLLRPIIICALDTGMRQGEILSLTWQNVNLEKGIISIAALNTKTLKSREIALTTRLKAELEILLEVAKSTDEKVFGYTTISKAFSKLVKSCNLNDLRFHDLRHTAATRMVQAGIPLPEVGRILGHTQANTTYRYVNANTDTARRVATALDNFNSEKK